MWADIHTHLVMIDDDLKRNNRTIDEYKNENEYKNEYKNENENDIEFNDVTNDVIADVLTRASNAKVTKVINIGTEAKDHPLVLDLAHKYPEFVFCSLGLHPHEADHFNPMIIDFIKEKSVTPDVVAVGEIGLDFFYKHSSKDKQIDVFYKQMDLAEQCKLPVQIHSRDAEKETIEVLKCYNGKVSGLIHCFTGSSDFAFKVLDLGYDISISGIITFKKADALRQVLKEIPLDRIHLETDAPFLSPMPHRGKINEPANVAIIAQFIAQFLKIDLFGLSRIINNNDRRVFPKVFAFN